MTSAFVGGPSLIMISVIARPRARPHGVHPGARARDAYAGSTRRQDSDRPPETDPGAASVPMLRKVNGHARDHLLGELRRDAVPRLLSEAQLREALHREILG